MTALKVMRSAGINPANGKEVFIDRDGNPTYEYDYRDKYVAGDTTPAVQGSFGLSMSWRSFDLSMNFAYRLGASIYNQTLATKVEGASPTSNADRRLFYDRWKAPGDKARYKNIANRETTPPTDRFVATEYALEGSSLKLSYTLPDACPVCGAPVVRDDPPRTRTGLSVRPRLSGVADRKSLIRWNASRSA